MNKPDALWTEREFQIDDYSMWEVFHENSKTERYGSYLSGQQALNLLENLQPSLSYETAHSLPLASPIPELAMSLSEAIIRRETPRQFTEVALDREALTTLLYYSYGETRDNEGTRVPRPFRSIPSGGGLFPLEIYLAVVTPSEFCKAGLYHYNPGQHRLELLREGDFSGDIGACFTQPYIAETASALLFATAIFPRSTTKYKDRGYRFALIEAGHWSQNVNLIAQALGLHAWNVGGYFDREVDRFLRIDGVNHSTIYINAIGGK